MRVLIVVSVILLLGLPGASFGGQEGYIEGLYKGKPGTSGEANHICIVKNAKHTYTVMISTIYCPNFPISDCSNGKFGSIRFDSVVNSGSLKYSRTDPTCKVSVTIKGTKAIVKVAEEECRDDFPYGGASGAYRRVSTKVKSSDCGY